MCDIRVCHAFLSAMQWRKNSQLQHVCLSVLLQMLMHANLQHVCRSVLLQLLMHANLQHESLSVLLQMLMRANLQHVCLSVLLLAPCRLQRQRVQCFWKNAKHASKTCHFTIQIRMAHSSAPPNWHAWLVAAHARKSFQSQRVVFFPSVYRWKRNPTVEK